MTKTIAELLGHAVLTDNYAASPLVDNNVLLGIEIEAENYSGNDLNLNNVTVKGDGSLRRNGIELAFASPLAGKAAYVTLSSMLKALHNNNLTTSCRTAMHVHVDMRNLTHAETMRFCVLYAVLEKALFNFVGKQREFSIYCVPWFKAKQDISNLKRIVNVPRGSAQRIVRNFDKYSALNVAALNTFGTVEFRHLLTTTDLSRCTTWINTILYMRQFAVNYRGGVSDFIEYCIDIDYKDLLIAVFGEEGSCVISYRDRPEYKMKGAMLMYALYNDKERGR